MSGKFQVDLTQLSKAAMEALEMMGLSVRNKDGQGDFITAKSNNPIRAYDTDGNEIKGKLLANGSKATAVLGYYDWTNPSGKAGRSPSIMKLVITDFIEYMGNTAAIDVSLEEAL
jgi:hypothetical protein